MDAADLTAIRAEIDAIDTVIHEQLLARSRIIDRLIEAKLSAPTQSAFRPSREVAMMARFKARHTGILPFVALESLWRSLIATFTYVQAPYTVHGDISEPSLSGINSAQDRIRYCFGFHVPYQPHRTADDVIEAVASYSSDHSSDLGVVTLHETVTPWWKALVGAHAPKILAQLPFWDLADSPLSAHERAAWVVAANPPTPEWVEGVKNLCLSLVETPQAEDCILAEHNGLYFVETLLPNGTAFQEAVQNRHATILGFVARLS
jgi:chorismate mutase